MMQFDYSKKPESLTMTKGDDWHLHVRDGAAMRDAIRHTFRQFGRALIMPNLKPPITKASQAWIYYEEIRDEARKYGSDFEPLMTLYLTDNTTPADVREAKESRLVHAFKYYPAGATTNSDNGVTDIKKVYPALEMMEESEIVLCVHGEVTDPNVDVFDREKVFLEKVFLPIRRKFKTLRMVFEHVTTKVVADFIGRGFVARGVTDIQPTAATITAHHLLDNRNALFKGGMRPHNYCLPLLKREEDRQALLQAATSGSPAFFFGTDSAPHAKHLKEHALGCAGCFTALHAMELCAKAFEEARALDKLEGFVSHFGADFYCLPRNTSTVTLIREEWTVPMVVPFGDDAVVPFHAGEKLQWKMI